MKKPFLPAYSALRIWALYARPKLSPLVYQLDLFRHSRNPITSVPRRFHFKITRRVVYLDLGVRYHQSVSTAFYQNGPLYPNHLSLRGA